MTREHVEALEESVAAFVGLAELMRVIAAATAIDSDAVDVITVLQRHVVYLVNRLDELTVPARAMLSGKVRP